MANSKDKLPVPRSSKPVSEALLNEKSDEGEDFKLCRQWPAWVGLGFGAGRAWEEADVGTIAVPMAGRSLEQTDEGKPRFRGCVSIREFDLLGKLGEGTFGEVYKGRSKRNGSVVALKKILLHNEKDGFPITALREIKLLKLLSHPNVLQLQEMAVERSRGNTPSKHITLQTTSVNCTTFAGEARKKCFMYMVTPYMEHDLAGLLENPNVTLTEPVIKSYMRQLLEGINYLHQVRRLTLVLFVF
ncbi:serine/threonine protein kinase, CMGC, CDC2/CDK sub [Ascosphaera aggregata]|nr:serine/threonine protein kinase, CMGC, CDC2/CDK sub [Ascosphaera aggregata]